MIKLGVVEIHVDNFEQSIQFYKERLGIPLIINEEDDKFAMFDTGETKIAVWAVKGTKQRKGNIKLYFSTKNIENTVKQLQKKGVQFTSGIKKLHWGKRVSFVDNEKNEHYFYEEKEYTKKEKN